jgi:hypothetical protein
MLGRVALLKGVSAVASEVGVVHRLNRVWPPATLDALGLLVLEKKRVRARSRVRSSRSSGTEDTNPAYETSPMV